jgi:hypothetical protein
MADHNIRFFTWKVTGKTTYHLGYREIPYLPGALQRQLSFPIASGSL